ncbi:MAG: (2Fe-2S)-binding protein [Prevotellaceae bacterium]|jgi:uncharacterized Fe-S cluster protein YjdI|nr:(2Fe-2S)-binding protein [Prevotellaceae bacterium]
MNILINGKAAEVFGNETIIETARREGCNIPSLCYAKGAKHKSSCMLCSVKNLVSGQIIPACSTLPVEGMEIETESEEINTIRTLSLELLLSDHRADCDAPCKIACPGGFDVAAMNRLYDSSAADAALEMMRDTLVIPATLCYICNAPCEKICRKKDLNKPVEIREIKKMLVATTQLCQIARPASNGKRAAVVGSNPAGLAAAYRLAKLGYEVTVFERADAILTPHIEMDKTPAEIVELEIDVMRQMGVDFVCSSGKNSFDEYEGLISVIDNETFPQAVMLTAKTRQPARLTLEGRKLADKLHASISGEQEPDSHASKIFNSSYSRFSEKEQQTLRAQACNEVRASLCLYCDCDRKNNCQLRDCATRYGVKNSRYSRETASQAMQRRQIGEAIGFEPAKCIRCGLCVYNSSNGFTFKNRGFGMQVALPEGNEKNIGVELAELCPTGALYLIKTNQSKQKI